MFVGRKKEMSKLTEAYNNNKFEMAVIYGDYVKIGLNQEKPYK